MPTTSLLRMILGFPGKPELCPTANSSIQLQEFLLNLLLFVPFVISHAIKTTVFQ